MRRRQPRQDGGTPEPTENVEAPAAAEPRPKADRARTRRSAEALAEPAAVNLLSPWVLDELKVVRLRKRFVAGGVALVLALGLGWTGLNLKLRQAEEEVRGAEGVNAGLSRQIADLGEVRTYVGSVVRRSGSVDAVAAAEVQFSRALVALDEALPRRAAYDQLTVMLPEKVQGEEGEAATCPGPDPFGAVPVVACLQLSGIANNRDDVSRLVQDLDADPLFVEPFVTTTSRGQDKPGVVFTGTVGLTDRVLAVDPADAEDAAGDDSEEGAR